MDNKTINYISPTILKIHPRNQEFFDDVMGEDYERFKQSIKNEGVLSPLIVTSDMTIISGHQRYRAAKELGLITVPVIIREDLTDEDNILKALIAANFGRIQKNESKLRKAIAEYVELCGYRNGEMGNGRKKVVHNGLPTPKYSMDEIAEQLGISKTNLKRALSIERNLTDSMKELLDTGVISKTVAADVITSLSESEQEELVSTLDATKKYTQKQIQEYIQQLSSVENLVADYKKDNSQLQQRLDQVNVDNRKLRSENETLKQQNQQKSEPIVKEVQVENPETLKELEAYRKDYRTLEKEYSKNKDELLKLKEEMRSIKANAPEEQFNKKLKDDTIFFCSRVADFIKTMGGYVWITDYINELPDRERRSYISAVKALDDWCSTILNNLNNNIDRLV